MMIYPLGGEARQILEAISGISVYQKISALPSARLSDISGPDAAALSSGVPESIVVTDELGIFIEGRGVEVVLRPLPKMLFLLFLKHPEGINFKDLSLYEEEMLSIYSRLSHRLDNDGMRRTIRHIFDIGSNSVNTQRSALAAMLARYFSKAALKNYVISGTKGLDKTILLDRSFVRWEADV